MQNLGQLVHGWGSFEVPLFVSRQSLLFYQSDGLGIPSFTKRGFSDAGYEKDG